MDTTTVIAFVIGVVFGGILCAIAALRFERKTQRQTADLLKQSNETQDRHYNAIVMSHRSVLQMIEAGDLEDAKRSLSDIIANYYQGHTTVRRERASIGIQPSEPDWIGRELSAIERDARKFECLRAALARKPAVSSIEELTAEWQKPAS